MHPRKRNLHRSRRHHVNEERRSATAVGGNKAGQPLALYNEVYRHLAVPATALPSVEAMTLLRSAMTDSASPWYITAAATDADILRTLRGWIENPVPAVRMNTWRWLAATLDARQMAQAQAIK